MTSEKMSVALQKYRQDETKYANELGEGLPHGAVKPACSNM